MMPLRWPSSFFFLLVSLSASVYASVRSFENTAIVCTVDLGGAVVHVTTTYAIKALEDGVKKYTVAMGRDAHKKTSWMEAKVKGQKTPLSVQERAVDAGSDYHLIDIVLPKALSANNTLNIVLETTQTHATYPWPATAAQSEEQALKYTTDLFVLSPYTTAVQRTKLKSKTPRVISATTPNNVESYADESVVTKSGATVVYGPFSHIPSSTNEAFIEKYQQPITIHYHYDGPVLEVLKLNRAVEISHWGSNLNTQDEITLHNAGPKLKGHFSRLEHQHQAFYKRPAPHVLPGLTLHLPSGIRNPYYYDVIGNVSTSKLRIAPSVPKNRQGTQFSILELKPRYPLLGGWNYSFTLGWDAPLEDSTSYDKSTGTYIVEVPIMTPILGAVVDEEDLTIIFPEAATDIQFATPFPAVSHQTGTHTTYLDTIGRPSLTFRYENLTQLQAQTIFVSYKVPTSAHLKKPVGVGAVFLSLFALAVVARRVNLTLHEKKKAS